MEKIIPDLITVPDFNDFLEDHKIELFYAAGGNYTLSYIDHKNQEWLISSIQRDKEVITCDDNGHLLHDGDGGTLIPPRNLNELCCFSTVNGNGLRDTPIKGNCDNRAFFLPLACGIEAIEKGIF